MENPAEELLDDRTKLNLAHVFVDRLFCDVRDAGGTIADTLAVLEMVVCGSIVDASVDPKDPHVEEVFIKNVKETLEDYRNKRRKPQ